MKLGPVRQFEGTREDEFKCQSEDQQVLVPGTWQSDGQPAGLWLKANLEGTGIEPWKQELVRGRRSLQREATEQMPTN